MRRSRRRRESAWEVAQDVFCLGPHGLTQTNIYFVRTGSSWVLVDAGWPRDAQRIQVAAHMVFGGLAPAAILLTHDHPDHEGAALQLARQWECPVHVSSEELPIALRDFEAMRAFAGPLDRWVILPLMRLVGRRRQEALFARTTLREVVQPFDATGVVPHLPDWQCVPTPGHTPGHVAYFRPRDRVLLSGDALVTAQLNSPLAFLMRRSGLSEPPWYTSWSRSRARESILAMADLQPAVVAGGHGPPMGGRHTAAALRAFADKLS